MISIKTQLGDSMLGGLLSASWLVVGKGLCERRGLQEGIFIEETGQWVCASMHPHLEGRERQGTGERCFFSSSAALLLSPCNLLIFICLYSRSNKL